MLQTNVLHHYASPAKSWNIDTNQSLVWSEVYLFHLDETSTWSAV